LEQHGTGTCWRADSQAKNFWIVEADGDVALVVAIHPPPAAVGVIHDGRPLGDHQGIAGAIRHFDGRYLGFVVHNAFIAIDYDGAACSVSSSALSGGRPLIGSPPLNPVV